MHEARYTVFHARTGLLLFENRPGKAVSETSSRLNKQYVFPSLPTLRELIRMARAPIHGPRTAEMFVSPHLVLGTKSVLGNFLPRMGAKAR